MFFIQYLSIALFLFSLASFCPWASSGPALAQERTWLYSPEAEKLFERGLEAYKRGKYEEAREHFQHLLEFPLNQRSSAGQLLLGKALFRLGQYEAALETARSLQNKFADSRYLPEARLLAGDAYYQLRRYYEAATQYGRLLATPAPLANQAQAAERLAAIVKNGFISAKALESIRLSVGDNRLRDALLFGEARWYGRLGWEAQAQAAMRTYRENVDGGIFAPLAGQRLALSTPPDKASRAPLSLAGNAEQVPATPGRRQREGRGPYLGLLLPMSGPHRQIGEELYAGAQLANEELEEPFELLVADIGFEYGDLPIAENPGSELLRVVEGARSLVKEGVLAIIGPVFSGSSAMAAVVAETAGVPLIAPLSQQSGLDEVGENVFQLNVIPELQGRFLGEYATLVLGLHNLAVLAPLSDYGWNFEREFTRATEENGGRVVHLGWYYPNETKDFRSIFAEIRHVGLELMTLAAQDSLARPTPPLGQAEEPSFLSELLADLQESARPPVALEKVPVDSAEIFIDAIDGMMIVVESFEDAKTIAPQVRFHRLTTQVLGNDIWCEPEAIRQMRPVDRAYLEGTVLAARHPEADQAFIDAFRRRFARDPHYAALGYDAARLVIEGWRAGHQDRQALRRWLGGRRGFEGASGGISFAQGRRANEELVLLKIDRNGLIRLLEAEDLPKMSPAAHDLPLLDLDIEEE
jgi:ABC-type branched-subunit amino acid transport system substrate-binding protein